MRMLSALLLLCCCWSCLPYDDCSQISGRARRFTDAPYAVLDFATTRTLLEDNTPDERLLKRLEVALKVMSFDIDLIVNTFNSLPHPLTHQLSAARIIDIENKLRNKLEEYDLILEKVRSLHQNASHYDNQTFLARAGHIRRAQETLVADVRKEFPDLLRTLDRNLRGATISGHGTTEGLICDVSVTALADLRATRNLTAIVRDCLVAMVDGLVALQKLSVDLYRNTCDRNDAVCLGRVAEFEGNPQRQQDRLKQCVPPWVISLAKDGVIAGRLRVMRSNKALTLGAVHYSDAGITRYFPELHIPQERRQQLVVLNQASSGYHRVVLGDTCYLSLRNHQELGCSAGTTGQDALFAVETSRGGDTWLYNVQTRRYLVAGESRERCREGGLVLSEQRGAPWTFDSSFSPGSGGAPSPRQCHPPTRSPSNPKQTNPADRSCPGLTALLLPLLTLAIMAAWTRL